MNYRNVTSTLLLLVIVGGLLAGILTPIVQAQTVVLVSVKPDKIYPGEAVTVTVDVYTPTMFKVLLCADATCTNVWNQVTRTVQTAGTYAVTLVLPELLSDAVDSDNNGLIDLWVSVMVGTTGETKQYDVYPKVKVTPSSATAVDAYGNPTTIKVNFLGFVPGDEISTVQFKGPITEEYTLPTSVTIDDKGNGTATIELLDITGEGLPRGTYYVNASTTSLTDVANAKAGALEIKPIIFISPSEGHGRCDAETCDLGGVSLKGYGFDADVNILKIELFNINFTKVKYVITAEGGLTTTDDYGFFELGPLSDYLETNMTAGLYIPIVYEAPKPQTMTETKEIALNDVGWIAVTEDKMLEALGTKASINATSYVKGKLDYVKTASRLTYTMTEVLRIPFTSGGYSYMITARLTDSDVSFALYNMSKEPPLELFSDETPLSTNPDPNTGAYYADVVFNVTEPPAPYELIDPEQATQHYMYWARFYKYANYIYLELKQWGLIIEKANLTIVYKNKDSGTTLKKFYVYPTNMSVSDTTVKIGTLKFTDAGISWAVDWSYDAQTTTASLTVKGTPITGPVFEFRNTYYIVRPLLVLLEEEILLPGDEVQMAAYGYGPNAEWGYPGYNTLYVYWEKIKVLGVFTNIDKDGNLTFKIKIPEDASFGVHYIWGVDAWGYEYTIAVIVGAGAYWEVVPVLPSPKVSAGYNNERVEVCPCPESLGATGMKFCAQCAKYGGKCDYLGDKVEVIVAGLSVGETVRVYFGDKYMGSFKANKSTESYAFVVPTVPEGNYTIKVVGTISGESVVTKFWNGTKFVDSPAIVTPKLLLMDLNKDIAPILVGPGFVRVLGTGFPVGTSILAVLFNGTDAAYALNTQVARWGADSSGVLTSQFTKVLGIYVPALEPGAYEVSLAYVKPGTGETSGTMGGYVYVINNLSIVATAPDVEKVAENVEALSGSLSSVLTTMNTKIDGIASTLATLGTAISGVGSKVDAVGGKVDTISTKVAAIDTLSGKVDAMSSKVDTISTKVAAIDTLSGK
ncbi:MAG: hypothetical protein QW705_05270, partial [Zestosphaera sp.]